MDAFADLKSEFVEQTRSEKFDDPAHLIRTRRATQSSHCSSDPQEVTAISGVPVSVCRREEEAGGVVILS